MQEKGALPTQMKLNEIETVCRAMIMYCLKFYSGDEKVKVCGLSSHRYYFNYTQPVTHVHTVAFSYALI